jgi:hypothetical protein
MVEAIVIEHFSAHRHFSGVWTVRGNIEVAELGKPSLDPEAIGSKTTYAE